jgi:Protein of unknown function, DUF
LSFHEQPPSRADWQPTSLIGGYLIGGYVPQRSRHRLLSEKPQIAGIALPGMPEGTPGMPGMEAGHRGFGGAENRHFPRGETVALPPVLPTFLPPVEVV